MSQRLLVSWIGHNDLAAMARESSDAVRDAVLETTRWKSLGGTGTGPVRTAVDSGAFAHAHLLSNYSRELNAAYRKWLGRPCTVHEVELTDPSDYAQVVACADRVMRELHQKHKAAEWCILLSPGTPAMAAIWVLLGKSRYPARFYQTFGGNMAEAVIPYELIDEYLPHLLRAPDEHLQRLAAEGPVRGFEEIVGESRAIRAAKGLAARAAVRDVSVLLLGESGTGKEEFARAIHKSSRRRDKPFVPVNCGAIPKELQEAELFGHAKGAFTGADRERAGAFALADGGTLFLDELGECPPALQVKLLRALQPPNGKGPCHRVFDMVGGKPQTADVRVLAATNRDLPTAIRDGSFREDLYYRLNVIEITLPPLAGRDGEVPLLADHLLGRVNAQFAAHEPGYRHKSLSVAAKKLLSRCPWPGNVRQLQNVLVRAAVLTDGDVIEAGDLETAVGTAAHGAGGDTLEHPLGNGFNLDAHLDEVRKHYLLRAMRESKGNKSRASKLLGMKHYQTLAAQIDRLGIEWGEDDGSE
ncbi:sigma 54-interacting transcriptional regulator [Gemmata sp. JC673]|uniref:Sigma 54-interacting transcriptional regulator n=1 Tax=Gemmata algarum TaxID=2975278 RepID=A0ABU5F7J1_9BACT|nr:sigma 54-interacting transcriptional regulator [Gemmata algarum]MDY3562695.1 sigma 54-interacting transcriptional regulator [Gemmata algarum]